MSLFGLGQSVVAWCLFAYLIAAVPVGLLVGWSRGVDLREVGSGNIGTTNAMRALGRKLGLMVFALDVLKAYAPVRLAMIESGLGPDAHGALALVALCAVLGHIYPVYLGFRGGKGVACALGVFTAVLPASGLLALVVYLLTLALTRVSAIGSLVAVTATSVHIAVSGGPSAYTWLALATSAVIWWRHRGNLTRILEDMAARKRTL
ncbi:MAG: glycerol-3-phosphate 1-O-acyltransferase PlsY [Myxococcales bacterium]|nr:glycerol-3-phosphate 1-O-acyltransferase PlsY [Myxococcales bacterium]MCB9750354.1 glycerol-3-phosphate 1-O-acyltransferase PlsY [Myxococcales bacterium]